MARKKYRRNPTAGTRALWIGGVAALAGVGVLLATKSSSAATPPSGPSGPSAPVAPNYPAPPDPATWRTATNSDLIPTVTQRAQQLLSSPEGTTVIESYGGKTWLFIVCSSGNCTPAFQSPDGSNSTAWKNVEIFLPAGS